MTVEMLSTRVQKAKKQFQCRWCGELIMIHEDYERQTLIFRGEFQSNAYHCECAAAIAGAEIPYEGYELFQFRRGTDIPIWESPESEDLINGR